MKYVASLLFLLVGSATFASPSYHESLRALIALENANNEADGEFSFLVCLQSTSSGPSNEELYLEAKYPFLATVFTHMEGEEEFGERDYTQKSVYNLVYGPYWSFNSLLLLYTEEVTKASMTCKDNETQFSCVRNRTTYELDCRN